jgi:hypothetical protein
MSRIGADHLAREAIVYVRQSTIDQVINTVESRRRQYRVGRAGTTAWLGQGQRHRRRSRPFGLGRQPPRVRCFWRRSAKAGSARWCRSRLRA